LRKFFGNSIKGAAEFSYISIGIGMVLGFLLDALSIPLPGIGKIGFGLSGVLIVALIPGKLRRIDGLNWTIPLSANLVLRNLGAGAVSCPGRHLARGLPRRSRGPAC
jgi:putative transport protein